MILSEKAQCISGLEQDVSVNLKLSTEVRFIAWVYLSVYHCLVKAQIWNKVYQSTLHWQLIVLIQIEVWRSGQGAWLQNTGDHGLIPGGKSTQHHVTLDKGVPNIPDGPQHLDTLW